MRQGHVIDPIRFLQNAESPTPELISTLLWSEEQAHRYAHIAHDYESAFFLMHNVIWWLNDLLPSSPDTLKRPESAAWSFRAAAEACEERASDLVNVYAEYEEAYRLLCRAEQYRKTSASILHGVHDGQLSSVIHDVMALNLTPFDGDPTDSPGWLS